MAASYAGWPSLHIDLEKVEDIRNIGMSMKISETLGISRSTLYTTLENFDLIGFTEISHHDLDELVSKVIHMMMREC